MNELQRSSLYQLSMLRFRLTLREPEAIFWVFIFPILLAVGLGIAFRNRPADVLQAGATTSQLTRALAADEGLTATTMDEQAGTRALATGSILLLAIQQPDGVAYRYDDSNPDARTARLLADRAIQTAAGRREAVSSVNQQIHEPGARYIDFVVPGLLGMNLMGSAIWGIGFSIVEARQKKLLKRLVASPMRRWQFLAAYLISRLAMLVLEVAAFLGFARLMFAVPFRGSLWQLALLCVLASLCVLGAGAAGLFAGQNHGGRVGTDEPGHATDVDIVRRLLLSVALPRDDSARGASVAADSGHRCPARKYASRDEPGTDDGTHRDPARVGGRSICRIAAHLPMEIEVLRSQA